MGEAKRIVYVRERSAKKKEKKPKITRPTFFDWIKILFLLFLATVLLRRFDLRTFSFFTKPHSPSERENHSADNSKRMFLAERPDGDISALASVRVAFWNLEPLDLAKISDPVVGRRIADIVAENDLTALVGLRSPNRMMIQALLYRLNGRINERFAALVSEPNTFDESVAFVYRIDRIAADADQTFLISGGEEECGPPVYAAAFAAKGASPESRFTFTAVAFRVESESVGEPSVTPADIYRAVQKNAGRGGVAEDDILLLGSLDAEPEELGDIRLIPNLATVNNRISTDSSGRVVDHIIFDSRSTTEYLQRYGVTDLAERFAVGSEEAKNIADHSPVWAEFSAMEN